MTDIFGWSGRVGDVWAHEWRRTDRSLAGLSAHLDTAVLAEAPERGTALDIGCGAGATAMALAAQRPHLAITGIDLSPELVAIARQRSVALANLTFEVADAQRLGARQADLLVSRHGVMFFEDAVAGFAALRASARPGATLVFSCFAPRAVNQWTLVVDAAVGNPAPVATGYRPGPYGLADCDFTAETLRAAGWDHAAPRFVDFAYVAGAGAEPVEDALDFLSRIGSAARTMAEAVPAHREAMRAALRAALSEHVADGAVTFRAGAWIWTAIAGESA